MIKLHRLLSNHALDALQHLSEGSPRWLLVVGKLAGHGIVKLQAGKRVDYFALARQSVLENSKLSLRQAERLPFAISGGFQKKENFFLLHKLRHAGNGLSDAIQRASYRGHGHEAIRGTFNNFTHCKAGRRQDERALIVPPAFGREAFSNDDPARFLNKTFQREPFHSR
jgi:hypothetical protein